MKIAISYPPIVNQEGQKAMVSQNRNVQFFKKPTYLLPVIHAQAATWLRDLGYDVLWDDGNSQEKKFDDWYRDLIAWEPDVVVLESTTPVMKFYWNLVNRIKSHIPKSIIVMTGYHSMRKPEETLLESSTDVVLKSNHIDFVLRKLIPYIDENENWDNIWFTTSQDDFVTPHQGTNNGGGNWTFSANYSPSTYEWGAYQSSDEIGTQDIWLTPNNPNLSFSVS